MARAKNIKIQLHKIIDDSLRIGESKHMAKQSYRDACQRAGIKYNPASAEGIYSTQTAESYRQTINEFSSWLKENRSDVWESKTLSTLTKDVCYEYLKSRQDRGLSAYTISKDMAALNKTLNLNMTKKEGQLAERSHKDVVRSRNDCQHDKKYNADNYREQIDFAKAFGVRRESIYGGDYQVRDVSLYRLEGQIYCSVIEKGGRFRNAPCLEQYKDLISSRYQIEDLYLHQTKENFKNIYAAGEDLFDKYTSKIDNHAFRGEYARAYYKQLCNEKGIDSQGSYDNDILKEVSQALGHNRVSVVKEHYMR